MSAKEATKTPSGRPLKGSKEARRMAAVVLETLGGLRKTGEAAEALGVSVARYYVLERRAIEGMIEGLERRPRGRRRSLEAELEQARRELEDLEQELARYQTLYRASQRAFGLPREDARTPAAKRKARTTRTRRKKSRAEKVLDRLENPAPPSMPSSDADSGSAKEA